MSFRNFEICYFTALIFSTDVVRFLTDDINLSQQTEHQQSCRKANHYQLILMQETEKQRIDMSRLESSSLEIINTK